MERTYLTWASNVCIAPFQTVGSEDKCRGIMSVAGGAANCGAVHMPLDTDGPFGKGSTELRWLIESLARIACNQDGTEGRSQQGALVHGRPLGCYQRQESS